MSDHICPNCGIVGEQDGILQGRIARLEKENIALAAEKSLLQMTVAKLRGELKDARAQVASMTPGNSKGVAP